MSRRWVVHPSVVCRELDGEAVLLHLDSGMYFGLDRVGTQVWALLAEPMVPSAICTRLLDEYDVALPVLEADVRRLVSELVAQQLLVPASEDRAAL